MNKKELLKKIADLETANAHLWGTRKMTEEFITEVRDEMDAIVEMIDFMTTSRDINNSQPLRHLTICLENISRKTEKFI